LENDIVSAQTWRVVIWVYVAVLGTVLPCAVRADLFQERVAPFAKKYCQECHNQRQAKGELDLTRFAGDRDVTNDFRRWNTIIEFIRDGEMPPEDKPQPTLEERNAVVAAIETILLTEAKKQAGDPGVVLPRRLSNTEYDLSLRDLTGAAIRATAEFPADPAGGEGFDNTGEALGMTPSLLNKYLGAAQFAAEHLVLKPHGIAFAPFPITSYNERKKFTEQAIINFYRDHDVRVSEYLESAWRYRHRGDADRGLSIEDWAARRGLSGRYLAFVFKTLDDAKAGNGYLKEIGTRWDSLPSPKHEQDSPAELRELEQLVAFARAKLSATEPQLIHSSAGNWPIAHLALRAKAATARDTFDPGVFKSRQVLKLGRLPAKKGETPPATTLLLRVEPAFDSAPGVVVLRRLIFSKSDNLPNNNKDIETQAVESLRAVLERESPEVAERFGFGKHPQGGELDADALAIQAPATIEIPLSPSAVAAVQEKQLLIECELDTKTSPESAVHLRHAVGKLSDERFDSRVELLLRPGSQLAKDLAESSERFCQAFPNRFCYVDPNRGLAAGFHLVEGFFRDDQPLVEKVLSEAERQELDRLWDELDFVTESVETLLRGFVWFERAERHVLHDKRFDFLRSEDPLLVEEELLSKFERLYLEKMGVKLVEGKFEPEQPSSQFDLIHGFFQQVRAGLAKHQRSLQQVEPLALADLERLAQRAFCRPLRPDEAQSFRGLYHRLRKQGQSVEDSVRGIFMAVLMSPDFFYLIPEAPAGGNIHPLSNDALARRLSYFLWSSLPDDELLVAARSGKLNDEIVLRAQLERMLKNPKIEAFAREFFGQWLRYRDYLSKETIPPGTFPGYDAALRQAMFDEPTKLITHLIQRDEPVRELLHGDVTFVNERLAKYYGGSIENQFRRLSDEFKRRGQPRSAQDEWFRVEGLRSIGRGGLFGMPVILAKNSAGQRTSPVKRGFWVVHHLLGQHFPPPPADVPELPKTEKEAAKTIRELLTDHTANRQCAMCHVHFDGLGLTMEGFDAIGRSRQQDLAGRAIQATGPLPGGHTAAGVSGLIEYVESHRIHDFERTLCRKFLGYALGRSVILSDQPLLQEMEKRLRTEGRFSVLFETVVLSPQFRQQRGREYAAANP
jgi:AraC-like DNA-binding protein